MRHFAVYSLGLFLLPPGALGQSENTLFGDFEIHDIPQGIGAPATFQILLLNQGLQVVGRETLGSKGRYRFLGVPNGEYHLVIQVGETEILRIYYRMQEARPTDVRKDIHLQWKEAFDSHPGSNDLLFYARTQSSQRSLDKARRQTQQGKLKEAVKGLERLLQSDPNDFEPGPSRAQPTFRDRSWTRLSAATREL